MHQHLVVVFHFHWMYPLIDALDQIQLELNEFVFDVPRDYLDVFFYYPNNENDVWVDDESKLIS